MNFNEIFNEIKKIPFKGTLCSNCSRMTVRQEVNLNRGEKLPEFVKKFYDLVFIGELNDRIIRQCNKCSALYLYENKMDYDSDSMGCVDIMERISFEKAELIIKQSINNESDVSRLPGGSGWIIKNPSLTGSCEVPDDNIKYAIAEFAVSKDDLYAVSPVVIFSTYKDAQAEFEKSGYSSKGGGTWQEHTSFEIIEIRNGVKCYVGGYRIVTVLG